MRRLLSLILELLSGNSKKIVVSIATLVLLGGFTGGMELISLVHNNAYMIQDVEKSQILLQKNQGTMIDLILKKLDYLDESQLTFVKRSSFNDYINHRDQEHDEQTHTNKLTAQTIGQLKGRLAVEDKRLDQDKKKLIYQDKIDSFFYYNIGKLQQECKDKSLKMRKK